MGNSDGSVKTRSLVEIINEKDELIAKLIEALQMMVFALQVGSINKRSQPFGERTTYLTILKRVLAEIEAAEEVE